MDARRREISHRNFLHRIHPTREPSMNSNREDISTLRLLVQLPIRSLDGVLPEIAARVKTPRY